MCGIAGVLYQQRQRRQDHTAAVHHSLQHRGPDAQTTYTSAHGLLHLYHTRLCIIDPSLAAAQPLRYNNRWIICYNGELYNYIELKKQLSGLGHRFFSDGDTEVAAAVWAQWGADGLQKMDGAFAFAVWDEVEETLFLARDRVGEKPLFFYAGADAFYFASQPKALWAMGVPKEVDGAAAFNFLTANLLWNTRNRSQTFFKDIQQLPAGYWLQHKNGEAAQMQWWSPVEEEALAITTENALQELDALLYTSVQRRLRSDVAIGTSLSGGLDSSVVVALCAATGGKQYSHKTFTAHFEGFEKNESGYAAQVARSFGLQHHLVTISGNNVPQLMQQVMAAQDEPVLSASPLAQYVVYEAAKAQGVIVVLDGQGADEAFAGYHKYYRWWWRELYRSNKNNFKKEYNAAQQSGIAEKFSFTDKLAALMPQLATAIAEHRKAKTARSSRFLNDDFAQQHAQDLWYTLPLRPTLASALFHDSFNGPLEHLLRMADRNSMAHGVEVRLPFLSDALLQFAHRLPAPLKIQEGWTKWLLRRWAEDKLPKEIVWRKDKIGFEPPQLLWMQQPAVQKEIERAKEKLVAASVLHPSQLRKAVQPHAAHAAANLDWKIWSLSFLY